MSSDRTPPRRCLRRTLPPLALVLLLAPVGGCGRKENPQPPPRKNPAQTTDLEVRQRGQMLYVTMSYPATTMGGLALPAIDRVEYKRYSRPAPEFLELPGEEAATETEAAETESSGAAPGQDEVAEDEVAEDEVEVEELEGGSTYESTPTAEEGTAGQEGEPTEEGGAMQPAGQTAEPNPFLRIRVDTEEFDKKAEEALVLEGTELENAVAGGQIVARFPLDEIPTLPPVAYSFQVRTFTGRLRSPDSTIASFVPLPPPLPPAGVSLEADAAGVRLAWEMPPGVVPKQTVTFGGTAAVDTPSEMPPSEEPTGETAQAEAEAEGSESEEFGSPEAITGVESLAEDGQIEIEGYNVYRRLAESSLFPPAPLATLQPAETEYLDRSAQYGSSYVYAITTVRMRQPALESGLSEELTIDYRDEFAPQPPRGLVLLAEAGRTRLVWEANAESDVVGYLVFVRRGDGDYERLTPEPIPANEYVHHDTISGATYSYQVIAVDTAGNESATSREATTRAP